MLGVYFVGRGGGGGDDDTSCSVPCHNVRGSAWHILIVGRSYLLLKIVCKKVAVLVADRYNILLKIA